MQYNKLDESAKGVYIISATPFKDNGALDIESTKKLMDFYICLLYTSPSPRDKRQSRMPSSA